MDGPLVADLLEGDTGSFAFLPRIARVYALAHALENALRLFANYLLSEHAVETNREADGFVMDASELRVDSFSGDG